MTSISLSEAFELGRTIMSPCRGGRMHGNDSKGCALDMAMEAVGAASKSWTDAYRIWPWLREPSGEVSYHEEGTWDHTWSLTIATKFDCDVMISQKITMDEFGSWLREVEERVAPPALSLVEIPVESEVLG